MKLYYDIRDDFFKNGFEFLSSAFDEKYTILEWIEHEYDIDDFYWDA